MRPAAFRVAYDGTRYRGFQRQPHGETVEDAIFEALAELEVEFEDGAPTGYAAAGRTDAGVSARAQTVAFEAPEWLTPRALNGRLPDSIRAWASASVESGFHATHDADERHYRYFLYAPEADDSRAEAAAERLSVRADFHNFTPDDHGTVRDPSLSVRRTGAFLVVDCRAGGFPRQFVRRVVSAVGDLARGERDPGFLDRALGAAPLPGPEGIEPAVPEPLVLFDVRYPGVDFEIDEHALADARERFERLRRRRIAGARVAGTLAPEAGEE